MEQNPAKYKKALVKSNISRCKDSKMNEIARVKHIIVGSCRKLGNPRVLYEIEDELSTSAIAVGDVTGSGMTELCTGGRDGVIRLYDANQSAIRLLAQQDVSGAILSIKIADANNDGQMEIVVGRSVGPGEVIGEAGTLQIYRYSPSGKLELLADYPVDRFITTVVVTVVPRNARNNVRVGHGG